MFVLVTDSVIFASLDQIGAVRPLILCISVVHYWVSACSIRDCAVDWWRLT